MGVMQLGTDEDERETILNRADGITAKCESFHGLAEFKVVINKGRLPDEVLEENELVPWIERTVQNHLERNLSGNDRRVGCQAHAREVYDPRWKPTQLNEDEKEFSVWVKFK